ncbi:MAG: MFS transporter, partial [bacterium]
EGFKDVELNKVELNKTDLKGSPLRGLIGATLGFFIGFAAVSLYGPAAKNIKDLMGLSGFALGLLVSIPSLTGSLLRIFVGFWADKVGGKIPFLTLFSIALIGMIGIVYILFNFYPNNITKELYGYILLFGALSGFAIAVYPAGITQVSYWYPKNVQGTVLAINAGVGNLAPGIFSILLPLAIGNFGLPVAYALWMTLFIIGVILYYFLSVDPYYYQLIKRGFSRDEAIKISQDKGIDMFPSDNPVESFKRALRNYKVWLLVLFYFASFGGFIALTAWLPSFFAIYYDLPIGQAGVMSALGFSILASLARVFYGYFTDKVGGELSNILSFILILVGSIFLVLSTKIGLSFLGVIIMALGMGFANASVLKLVAKYVPESVSGAGGMVAGLGAFGGFVFPPLMGIFVDIIGKEGYRYGFTIFAIFSILALIISFYLYKKFHLKEK